MNAVDVGEAESDGYGDAESEGHGDAESDGDGDAESLGEADGDAVESSSRGVSSEEVNAECDGSGLGVLSKEGALVDAGDRIWSGPDDPSCERAAPTAASTTTATTAAPCAAGGIARTFRHARVNLPGPVYIPDSSPDPRAILPPQVSRWVTDQVTHRLGTGI